MVTLRAGQIMNMVEHSYFSNLDHRRPETVLDCFATDAVLTVQPPRAVHTGRDRGIKEFVLSLLTRHQSISHSDLDHVIDVERQRIASRFMLRLVDTNGREIATEGCAMIVFANGKFKTLALFLGTADALG